MNRAVIKSVFLRRFHVIVPKARLRILNFDWLIVLLANHASGYFNYQNLAFWDSVVFS